MSPVSRSPIADSSNSQPSPLWTTVEWEDCYTEVAKALLSWCAVADPLRHRVNYFEQVLKLHMKNYPRAYSSDYSDCFAR